MTNTLKTNINSLLLVCFAMLLSGRSVRAQQPVFTEDFEHTDSVSTIRGISGRALDLGPRAIIRQALARPNPLKGSEEGFSATVWVKGETSAQEAYDVLTCLQKTEKGYDGWKISMTAQGAWAFTARSGDLFYEYTTSAPRQSIRDGAWHLVAVTYSGPQNELRFYYDGKPMAIYRADGMQGFFAAPKLVIGAGMDSEHYFEAASWQTFWDSFDGQIDDIQLFDQALTAATIADYYQQKTGIKPVAQKTYMPGLFKLTTFNIFHGAHEFGKEAGKNRLVDIMRQTGSDAFTVVETYGSGAQIADALGYYLYLISSNLSIISKYPIVDTYRVKESFKGGGAQLELPDGKKINLFCVWLDWQPAFHSGGFTNNQGWTLDQYMAAEKKGRGADIQMILQDVKPYIPMKDSIPLIVAGDFNSGSHLDWTEQYKSLHKGYVIPWPASTAMVNAGFTDSYREHFPDVQVHPGETFSDHYKMWIKARIDYIYYQGSGIKAIESEVIDKHPVLLPSDHAAVSTLFQLRSGK